MNNMFTALLAAAYSVTPKNPVFGETGAWIVTDTGAVVSSGWTVSGFIDDGEQGAYRLHVFSNGMAYDYIKGSGHTCVSNGGVVSGLRVTALTPYHTEVLSGGTLYGVTLSVADMTGEHPLLTVSNGGVASGIYDSNATAVSNCHLYVYDGGRLYDVHMRTPNPVTVSSGGYLSGAEMTGTAKLNLYNGGYAENIKATSVTTDNSLLIYSGASAANMNFSSASLYVQGGVVSNLRFQDNTLYISSRGSACGISTVNAALNFNSAYISGWTMLRLKNGGTAPKPYKAVISDFVFSVTVPSASYTIQLQGGCQLYHGSICEGIRMSGGFGQNGCMENVVIGASKMDEGFASAAVSLTSSLTSGRYVASGITLLSGGSLIIQSGHSAKDITLSGGYLQLTNGGTLLQDVTMVEGTVRLWNSATGSNLIISGGTVELKSSGAYYTDITIYSGGYVVLDAPKVIVSNVVVGSGGSLLVKINNSALHVVSNAGATVTGAGYIEYA